MSSYSVLYMGPATADPSAKAALMNKIIMQRLAQGFQLCNKPPAFGDGAGGLAPRRKLGVEEHWVYFWRQFHCLSHDPADPTGPITINIFRPLTGPPVLPYSFFISTQNAVRVYVCECVYCFVIIGALTRPNTHQPQWRKRDIMFTSAFANPYNWSKTDTLLAEPMLSDREFVWDDISMLRFWRIRYAVVAVNARACLLSWSGGMGGILPVPF